jgi:ferredoxin
VTYIIADPCIDIKDRSCVDVCPVDCIHEAARILVIDPEECIDCGACEPECPVEAIFPEDALPGKWEPFVRINYAYGEGLEEVNRLVEDLRRGDDGAAGVREPRTPPPDAPGGADALSPD